MTIRVLTADDHPVVRTGISAIVANQPDMSVVAEAVDGLDAVALYDTHSPDVVLMDLRMPRLDGIGAIRAIVEAHREARVVALTSYEGDADIYRALDAGGWLPDQGHGRRRCGQRGPNAAAGKRVVPRQWLDASRSSPAVDLTPREVEVLRLTAKGLRNRDIGRVIGRTDETVKVHLKHIMAKLDVEDRTEAVTLGLQRGIIHLDD